MIAKTPSSDIAIVGAGPCGLALAGILERAGFDYVVYERGCRNEVPRGGCLDLHAGSGQRACREAGCFDLMRKYGRLGDATEAWVWDPQGNKMGSWGKGRDAPELDRYQIKLALLTTIPPEKIRWNMSLNEATKDDKGRVSLHFADGTTAAGFKLVVGADGVNSKIRHLVTPAKPQYSGKGFVTGHILPDNLYYPTAKEMAGVGPQAILGRHSFTWNQMQADGRYRVDLGMEKPGEFSFKNLDLTDTAAVKKLLLSEQYFGGHGQYFKDMVTALDGPFHLWPLWYMPVESLNWAPNPGVTLIGDAAHVTTPFVGDGVNCGMRDAIILVEKLKESGITVEAIASYEKEMFAFAIDMIERSQESGRYMFDFNAPAAFFEGLANFQERTGRILIGATDDY
ncbi:Fc.00g032900.m01.CDS01 [Cosmosporella sp. VM-42]